MQEHVIGVIRANDEVVICVVGLVLVGVVDNFFKPQFSAESFLGNGNMHGLVLHDHVAFGKVRRWRLTTQHERSAITLSPGVMHTAPAFAIEWLLASVNGAFSFHAGAALFR